MAAASFYLTESEPSPDSVRLRARLSNIDDHAALFLNCKKVLSADLLEQKHIDRPIKQDAVIAVQVENDRWIYAWDVRVVVDGNIVMLSKDGRANLFGANGNDKSRPFETVLNRSVKIDGSVVSTPDCIRPS